MYKLFFKRLLGISQILARFSPLLLGGAEEELINFLKDDNEIIKEGILHVLAKAGGTIREQLAVSSRCNFGRLDLLQLVFYPYSY